MTTAQKVNMYIQNETIMAFSWEINQKIARVWVLAGEDFQGQFDLCEIEHKEKNKIKSFIRDVLKNGKYVITDPMNFDTIGFDTSKDI